MAHLRQAAKTARKPSEIWHEDTREVGHFSFWSYTVNSTRFGAILDGILKLDPSNHVKGSNALDCNRDGKDVFIATSPCTHEERKAVVQEEMDRMTKLPANSSYVTHRMRVLNKILHLLSIQRTTSQTEELELLFAGLSL